ncbi:hypothetical protein I3843_14G033900 [Carya illinoinensis]|nr:hypothetical protein I3760_02G184300 [Carya illinoinensis]KAG7946316.1 hypothetical protein I3843_14G033900 [Carya illinoinensis]
MGAVPGRRSIEKSTSRSGGNPGRSSGNTSGNSLTTGISSSLGPSTGGATRLARNPKHPCLSNLVACKTEISRGGEFPLLAQKLNSSLPGVLKTTSFLKQSTQA